MSQKKKEILNAIEYSMFMYPAVEGVMEEYKHESLKGYVCPMIDFEELNRVGMTRLSEEQTEEVIEEVLAHFSSLGLKKIGWFVSPQSKPDNLEEKLINSGFKKEIPYHGMVRPISRKLDIEITDEFEFKIFKEEEAIEVWKSTDIYSLFDKAYGAPEGTGKVFSLIGDSLRGINYTLYIAYERNENKPIAFAAISTVPNTKCAILNGAATISKYRRKGIYSAFLKMRYEQAKREGIEHLIIQANEGTSAPIAAKNGFEKVCEMPLYVWRAQQE